MTREISKVTIGIPTYNRVEFLEQAIESAIAQSYPDVEIIVSDNYSIDNTQDLLERYAGKIKVILQKENIGMTRNWDACLSAATGKFFLLLSDDDFLEPDAIEQLVAGYMDETDSKAFIYGRTLVHKANGTLYRHPVTPPDCENVVDFVLECYRNQRFAPTSATLFRTAELRSVGGYWADQFNLAPDSAVMMKTSLLDPKRCIQFVDAVVFNYRIHSANLTGNTKLLVWADEIVKLSNIILERLNVLAPSGCKNFLMWRDRYVVSFVLSQAVKTRPRSYIERCKSVLYCYRVCFPYLGFRSLKTFCYWAAVLILPCITRLKLTIVQKSHNND